METRRLVGFRNDRPERGSASQERIGAGTALWVAVVVALITAPTIARAEGADPPTRADVRSKTIEILSALPGRSDGSLRIRIEQGGEEALPIGRRIQYQVASDRPGYLALFHVDAHGVVTVIYPNEVEPNLLRGGQEKGLPPIDVAPPIGREELFLVVTEAALTLENLGVLPGRHGFAIAEGSDGPAIARRLRGELQARGGEIALARFTQRVVPRADGPTLLRGEIIETFSNQTRSIRRPRLDLPIQFETDSTRLSELARRDLDEFGIALSSSELVAERFFIGGHTDDVGEEEYNFDLSQRRAERVRDYLVEEHGVSSERLLARAYGETDPLERDTTDEARKVNRRVEFSLAR
jgi:outer membrane protein OmpA-like peptidoglycan-associated protein